MIKIKVLQCRPRIERDEPYKIFTVADYLYCIYVFGILMHTVTVYNIDSETAERLFGKYGIIPF